MKRRVKKLSANLPNMKFPVKDTLAKLWLEIGCALVVSHSSFRVAIILHTLWNECTIEQNVFVVYNVATIHF